MSHHPLTFFKIVVDMPDATEELALTVISSAMIRCSCIKDIDFEEGGDVDDAAFLRFAFLIGGMTYFSGFDLSDYSSNDLNLRLDSIQGRPVCLIGRKEWAYEWATRTAMARMKLGMKAEVGMAPLYMDGYVIGENGGI
jgi:hypothetical protein